MSEDRWFDGLAQTVGKETPERAPARLTSKVYSAIVLWMSESGALLDLAETQRAGGHLCVFENVLTVLPIGKDVLAKNPCRMCHARVLAERMEHAPIFWPGCPYSEFHHG
jgi:hypothetical protein